MKVAGWDANCHDVWQANAQRNAEVLIHSMIVRSTVPVGGNQPSGFTLSLMLLHDDLASEIASAPQVHVVHWVLPQPDRMIGRPIRIDKVSRIAIWPTFQIVQRISHCYRDALVLHPSLVILSRSKEFATVISESFMRLREMGGSRVNQCSDGSYVHGVCGWRCVHCHSGVSAVPRAVAPQVQPEGV